MKTGNLNNQKWTETYRASIISVCAMLLLLVATVICHLFGWRDAPFQFLAACLGAGVTVIITNLLLVEQTKQQQKLQEQQAENQQLLQENEKKQDLKQAKETEQYKEKLHIYQDFLQSLYDVFKDREVNLEEKISLQFKTAMLAIHTKSNHIQEISNSVGEIVSCLCTPKKDYDVKKLQESLFNIVEQFRAELYEGQEDDGNALKTTLDNFVKAYSAFGSESDVNDLQEMGNNPIETQDEKLALWNSARSRWEKKDETGRQQWTMYYDGETIRLHRPEEKEIHVQFGFWRGHYYIQATYKNIGSFSQQLKWKFQGSKTYATWWSHLHEHEFYDMKEGEFWSKFIQSESMQKTLVEWFDRLIDIIDKQDVAVKMNLKLHDLIEKNACVKDRKWNIWYYWWDTLVCEDKKNEQMGVPFIDTFNEDGKTYIRFGNRKNNREVQKQILQKIGLDENDIREDNRTDYAVVETNNGDDVVAQKLTELMEKLSKI